MACFLSRDPALFFRFDPGISAEMPSRARAQGGAASLPATHLLLGLLIPPRGAPCPASGLMQSCSEPRRGRPLPPRPRSSALSPSPGTLSRQGSDGEGTFRPFTPLSCSPEDWAGVHGLPATALRACTRGGARVHGLSSTGTGLFEPVVSRTFLSLSSLSLPSHLE